MNKGEFIKAVSEKGDITLKDAEAAFRAITDVIVDVLKTGDKIQLAGFGVFELKEKAARVGLNPATGEKVDIAASNSPSLHFGKAYKDLFNK
ncbi:MAG: HU family DNA-binding protein [Clostridiaceae bacterium]|jgi:DNA-binding protein HU-beta|nr:HU family DNA-binding protein [Clostridiaceae bacterium]